MLLALVYVFVSNVIDFQLSRSPISHISLHCETLFDIFTTQIRRKREKDGGRSECKGN